MTARLTVTVVFQPEGGRHSDARLLTVTPDASMTRKPHERMTDPWSLLQHVHPRMHRNQQVPQRVQRHVGRP
jgi:hypothetical protein